MEIWHFFVIFHDFVMKCVYKSTIYTFVIRDKIWTPPFVVQKCTCYFCVLGPENTPPPPYMSGTFVLAPPPAVMCNCAYYKINFTGLLKILIKLHKISAKYYENNNMDIWVCNRCAYFTRIVKGEKGECRGERETGKGKMEECRL